MKQRNKLLIALLLIWCDVQVTLAGDIIKVCGQNVQNFFYSLDRSRTTSNGVPLSNYTTAEGRQAKAEAIVKALAPYQADVYAFNEVEVKAIGADAEALDILADEMGKKTGYQYEVVSDGLTYDLSEDATGMIKSGFIYRTDKVEPVGSNVSTAVGYDYVYPYMLRMQTFRSLASGEEFSLSMNHFKASTSGNMTEDASKREQNSIALLKGLNAATDPDILLMGDLNSELGEQCLDNLVDAGFEEQIVKYQGTNTYSYWYNSGILIDHVFANSTMARQISDAKVLHIANPHSVGKKNAYSDHDPYLVTLNLEAQPAPVYAYAKATQLTTGTPYLMVAPINGLKAAKPVATDKSYEYQLTTDVTETDGYITMDDGKSAFIFEDDGNGNYYIKDYYGRYLYQFKNTTSGKYSNSTNVGVKSNAHPFSVTRQADGTFKILNTVSSCYFIGLVYKNTPEFALYNYSSLSSSQHLPWLYQYDSTYSPTGISTVEVPIRQMKPRKVLRHGTILIVMPDGRSYSLQGIENVMVP